LILVFCPCLLCSGVLHQDRKRNQENEVSIKFYAFHKIFTVLDFLSCPDIPEKANRPAMYKINTEKEDRKIRTKNGRPQ
jgi:hypothetical protein